MQDKKITVEDVKKEIACFVRERDWEQFHSPKNLSMSITIEAAELMELLQWTNPKRNGKFTKTFSQNSL